MTAATGDLLALALGRAIVGISLAEPEAALTMCAKAVADAYRAEMGKALATSDSRRARAHGKRAGPVVDDRGRDDEGEEAVSKDMEVVAEWVDHHVVRAAQGPTPGCACD